MGHPQIKAPQITNFRLPVQSANTCVIYAVLLYITFPDISPLPLFTPARTIHAYLGGLSTLKLIWQVIAVLHILESLYTLSLCKRHRTGFVVGVRLFIHPKLTRTN
jgi:hypothetical protein